MSYHYAIPRYTVHFAVAHVLLARISHRTHEIWTQPMPDVSRLMYVVAVMLRDIACVGLVSTNVAMKG
jgi:hypothetical protein